MKRKQFSVSLGIRGKRVVMILLACFMVITIPILLKRYWNYFDGLLSGTYVAYKSNDMEPIDSKYTVVLDQHYFCYNDVVEADFTIIDHSIMLDMNSIRIKENSSDIYTDAQKQEMLDEIIYLAENGHISLGGSCSEVFFGHDVSHFIIFWRVE
jgi:hypothetical protein